MTQCYMCEKDSISQEHVPPICIFPEKKDIPSGVDYRKNLIKVPACYEHNLQKSGDDEYFLFLLVTNCSTNKIGLHQWTSKVLRSINNRPKKIKIFRNLRVYLVGDAIAGHFDININRIDKEIDKISRGLYYHHFHHQWLYPIMIVNPSAVQSGHPYSIYNNYVIQKTNAFIAKLLENDACYGDNPEIFYYQYKVDDKVPYYVLRMVFHGGVVISSYSNIPKTDLVKRKTINIE